MIEIFRILFDTGLLVLIWMVQLIVYPSFLFYRKEKLEYWHSIYVKRISFIVIPLMFGQTLVAGYQLYQGISTYTLGSIFLILAVWALTFLLFVPRHNTISNSSYTQKTLTELVSLNWYRTLVWTLILLWTLITRV